MEHYKYQEQFWCHKRPISIKKTDINKIVVSNKVSFGKKDFKHFIGYKYAKKLFLPKMSACRRDIDEIKYTSLLRKNYELLEKYNEIWEKLKNSIKKEFDSEPVYNENIWKLK